MLIIISFTSNPVFKNPHTTYIVKTQRTNSLSDSYLCLHPTQSGRSYSAKELSKILSVHIKTPIPHMG